MIKKTIEYDDYNGAHRKETYYFNLEEAEIAEMQLTTDGGLAEKLQMIIDARDLPTLIRVFKDIVLRSYGVKSDDGKRFKKTQELRDAFEQSKPYSILFMELATDAKAAAEFINGIVPENRRVSDVPAVVQAVSEGID